MADDFPNSVRDDDVFLTLAQADGTDAYLTIRKDGREVKAFIFGEGLVPDQLSQHDLFVIIANALFDLGTYHGYTIKGRAEKN